MCTCECHNPDNEQEAPCLDCEVAGCFAAKETIEQRVREAIADARAKTDPTEVEQALDQLGEKRDPNSQ